jgi:hypothetical protein
MKYRKKPVVIDAILWNGDNLDEMKSLGGSRELRIGPKKSIFIHTMEGIMEGNVGDFIIKGVKGELYPCKPDIFDETYEKVNDGIT